MSLTLGRENSGGCTTTFKQSDRKQLLTAILTNQPSGVMQPPCKTFRIEVYVSGFDGFSEQHEEQTEAMKRMDHILTFFGQ